MQKSGRGKAETLHQTFTNAHYMYALYKIYNMRNIFLINTKTWLLNSELTLFSFLSFTKFILLYSLKIGSHLFHILLKAKSVSLTPFNICCST